MSKRRVSLSLSMAIISLVFISAIFLAMIPVANPTSENTEWVLGKVEAITEGGTHDVIIKLTNDTHHYYINRGLEKGLQFGDLQPKLEGSEISLRYIKHWSLLNPSGKVRPVAELSQEGQTLFGKK